MPGNSNITSPFTSPPSFARDSWPATLDSLGEHLDNLELTFEQQSRHMGTLLAQYKAALAQHRQALSQQFAQPSQLGARTPTWTQRPGGAGASAGSGRTAAPARSPTLVADRVLGPLRGSTMELVKMPNADSDGDSDSLASGMQGCGMASEDYDSGKDVLHAEPGSLQHMAIKLTSHYVWPIVTTTIVLLQTVVLGIVVDAQMQELLGDQRRGHWTRTATFYEQVAKGLIVVWMVEISIKLVAERSRFFERGSSGLGNMFEVFLLSCALLDLAQSFIPLRGRMIQCVQFIRVFRAFRLIRLLSVCQHFKALHQLRWMTLYILTCIPTFGWALALLIMFIFIWAILFEDLAIFYLEQDSVDRSDEVVDDLRENWGSMNLAMISLIFSLTGGADYGDLMKPFQMISPAFGWIYILFVVMVTLCLLNVLVGIFVQESEDIKLPGVSSATVPFVYLGPQYSIDECSEKEWFHRRHLEAAVS
ncbi:unnamed protein product [Prorocentrum cordatum]|uniref:Ion transport domain-containing protein n=1 Tax=Prorocentrum cordatum TaxID=2364126 RepID=A0ABN9P9K3_9DINO|nr:unnamed protein product [Polarella glacialis]